MAGLLDFLQTPAGVGLLSAVAGGMAGARRGTPWNNVGRGLVGGLTGYATAQDQIRQDSENALTKQYRQLQMDQLQNQIENQKALRAAAQGAAQDATKPAQFSVGGQAFPTQQAAQLGAQTMFSLPAGAIPDSMLQKPEQRPMAFQPTGELPQPQTGIADFSMGQIPQVTQQKTPDMRTAMYNRLMQAGFPEEAVKYAPKWAIGERFNEATGMPEKVLFDENNPSNAVPFGGTQADTIVADNLGGQMVYRGSHSATPMGQIQRTVSPDSELSASTARRGQDISNANAAAARAVTIRGQDVSARTAATGKPPTEAEAKAAFYAGNMRAASQVLDNLEKKGFDPTSTKGQVGTYLAGGMTNALAGKVQQQARQAQNQWAEQMLRMQTGAAATQDEINRTVRTYFPSIGDDAETVAQKRAARQQAEQGVFAASGRAANRVQQPASGGVKFLGFE